MGEEAEVALRRVQSALLLVLQEGGGFLLCWLRVSRWLGRHELRGQLLDLRLEGRQTRKLLSASRFCNELTIDWTSAVMRDRKAWTTDFSL